jgi:hypothetical protein
VDTWHVLVCGLPLAGDAYDLGASVKLRRLVKPLTVFDLAAAGAVGFREWAVLEPLAHFATSEIVSPNSAAAAPGYDALNKCWLASSLLVLRGFSRHLCLAASAYSWNFIAGHQESSSASRQQLADEGVENAVYEPWASLPPFRGQLLDYHLRLLVPKEVRCAPFDSKEAEWIAAHLDRFNQLAANEERFRFALEAAVDWRYAKDPRAALARIWAGVESLLAINAELVYRVSLYAATVLAPRGPQRIAEFKRIKALYATRSKAVHGEPTSQEKLFTGVHESFEVLRTLLLDAVQRGSVRSEKDFCEELLS